MSVIALHAQETWTAMVSPTTRNLWGVTWGGGQFVAVGEGGTILTSPDGAAWTARASGTTNWLLAVAYAPPLQRYVAVGEQGTLLTSPDAITWTPGISATSQRLNGITYFSGTYAQRFIAVGENSVIDTSADGVNWTPTTTANAGWWRGVAQVGSQLALAVGQSKLPVSGGGTSPVLKLPYLSPTYPVFDTSPTLVTAKDLEAIASDGTNIVYAGGDIFVSHADAMTQPYDSTKNPGWYFRGAALFNNTWFAVGTGGTITYGTPGLGDWNVATGAPAIDYNAAASSPNVAIAVGANGTIVRSLPAVHPPSAAWVSVAAGTTRPYSSVTLSPVLAGTLPMSFQWKFNGQPIAGATAATYTLTGAQPVNSGNYTVTLSNAYGISTSPAFPVIVGGEAYLSMPSSLDRSFGGVFMQGPLKALAVQSDGKLLVNGSVWFVPTGYKPGIARLTATGAVDSTFQLFAFSGSVTDLAPLPDGRVLLHGAFQLPGSSATVNFARLNADGTLDPTFTPLVLGVTTFVPLASGGLAGISLANNTVTLTRVNPDGTVNGSPSVVAIAPSAGTAFDASYTTVLTAPTASGQTLVAFVSRQVIGTGTFGVNDTKLIRLRSDGSVDSAFPMVDVPVAMRELVSTEQGIVYIAYASSQPLGYLHTTSLGGLTPSGAADPTFTPQSWITTYGDTGPTTKLLPDGSALILTNQIGARYDNRGRIDPEYILHLDTSGIAHVTGLAPTVGGAFYVFGYNGDTAPGDTIIQRVLPNTHISGTRLANLSVRQFTSRGDGTLTLGFVVAGQGTKTMLVRGIGPTLATFNVRSTLADPELKVFDAAGSMRASNDNWSDSTNANAVAATGTTLGAFPLRVGSLDAAALLSQPSGAFTAQIGAVAGTADGIALAEAYDADPMPADASAARVVNFSARGTAGTSDATLIAGFNISGPGTRRVLIRAVGPSLARFGVGGALADPVLSLYSDRGLVTSNNDWNGAAELKSAFAAVGAFGFSADDSHDAALLLTLPAGSYTAQISGAGGTTGIALIEVYELPLTIGN